MGIERKAEDHYVVMPLEHKPLARIAVLRRQRGKKLVGQVWPGSVANITAAEARAFAEGLDQAAEIAGGMDQPAPPAPAAPADPPKVKRNNVYHYTIFPLARQARTYTQAYRTRVDHEIFIFVTCVSGLSAIDARTFAAAIRQAADIADMMAQPGYTGYFPEYEEQSGG